MVNQERLLAEFCQLVTIDSASGQEREIADELIAKLQALGCSVREDQAGQSFGGNAGNVIARLPGRIPGPTLLLSAHMDRVNPGTSIQPQIDHGIIRSNGTTILAADDVAGIVGILEAIRIVQEQQIPHSSIEVLFTVSEERGLRGAKALHIDDLQGELGFFLDAAGDVGTVVNSAPANSLMEFTFVGKAAHAGNCPENGVNAIVVCAHALANMRIGRIDHETTANIGVIRGGTGTNVVAERVHVQGEVRSRCSTTLQSQVDHMVQAARSAAAQFGAQVETKTTQSYPAFVLDPAALVVQRAVAALETIGITPQIEATGGGSDANIVNGLGIPSVALGIGFEDVHSTKESISVESLVHTAQFVVALITRCST